MKLGKLAPQWHPRTLMLRDFLDPAALPTPHSKVYREYKTPPEARLMFGNDRYGCCVWAMFANLIILSTCHTGKVVIPMLDEVLEAYSAVTGFDPSTGANDNGTVMTQAMEYMQTTGIGGYKILGWAQIDPSNLLHRKIGCDMFGATCVGVNFPSSGMTQFQNNTPWEVDLQSPNDGGHAILRPGYGSAGDDYVTWSRWDQKASAAWSKRQIDEEYVVITPDWAEMVQKKAPEGLDLTALMKALAF